MGINMNTVPVLDLLIKNKSNIIGDRSYSRDPKLFQLLATLLLNYFIKIKL